MEFNKQYYTELLESGVKDRQDANEMSLLRRSYAKPMGILVELMHEDENQERLLTALGAGSLAGLWYTDRQDGIKGRRSISKAEVVASSSIDELVSHNDTLMLLDKETTSYGAKLDADTDKELRNEISRGLMKRSVREGDVVGVALLALDKVSTHFRDKKMEKIRDIGREKGIDVKANGYGKFKTLLQVIGTSTVAIGKKKTKIHRAGLALVASSHIPSWLGYFKMKRHVEKIEKGKRPKKR